MCKEGKLKGWFKIGWPFAAVGVVVGAVITSLISGIFTPMGNDFFNWYKNRNNAPEILSTANCTDIIVDGKKLDFRYISDDDWVPEKWAEDFDWAKMTYRKYGKPENLEALVVDVSVENKKEFLEFWRLALNNTEHLYQARVRLPADFKIGSCWQFQDEELLPFSETAPNGVVYQKERRSYYILGYGQ